MDLAVQTQTRTVTLPDEKCQLKSAFISVGETGAVNPRARAKREDTYTALLRPWAHVSPLS